MSREMNELQNVLRQLVVEHQRLVGHLDAQQAAMKTLDLKSMDEAMRAQEACRLRISGLERQRRIVAAQLGRLVRVEGDLTLGQLVELFPQDAAVLNGLREQLKGLMKAIASRTAVSGRLAGAVLGHVNTVIRMLASAVEPAGVYTKQGVPRVAQRIGVMEAVG